MAEMAKTRNVTRAAVTNVADEEAEVAAAATAVATEVAVDARIARSKDTILHDWAGCFLNPESEFGRYDADAARDFYHNQANGPNSWYRSVYRARSSTNMDVKVADVGSIKADEVMEAVEDVEVEAAEEVDSRAAEAVGIRTTNSMAEAAGATINRTKVKVEETVTTTSRARATKNKQGIFIKNNKRVPTHSNLPLLRMLHPKEMAAAPITLVRHEGAVKHLLPLQVLILARAATDTTSPRAPEKDHSTQ